jgi:uncharacterized protein (TIGR00730 family)
MKTQRLVKPPKAYKNIEFLNSPEARTIRMLAEFLEPQARFRQYKVQDTIVFFGSARLRSRDEAMKKLKSVRREVDGVQRPTREMLKKFREAQVGFEMSRYYEEAVVLSRLLTEWSMGLDEGNRFVVCSGGGPGIMEAANKGARLAGGKTVGLNISLPFEQYPNPYITPGLGFEFHYFFMRKFWFMYLSKALVAFPGGFGTFDELMEVLTLLQTQKTKKQMAVVVYGTSYWNKVVDFEEMVNHGLISRDDLNILKFVDTPEDAFEYLKRYLTEHYLEKRQHRRRTTRAKGA